MKKKPFPISEALQRVITAISDVGGRPIAVGGCVRDHLLGLQLKDLDLEIYDIELDDLERALNKIGKVYAVGKSFGVLKLTLDYDLDHNSFDISLPRTESKSGRGHRGFIVATDKSLSFKEAASRRDFTMNTIGYDLLLGNFIDPFNGIEDLKNSILRHVSDSFSEDPLRVFRGFQFAARFDLVCTNETIEKCKELRHELKTLPRERIYEEIKKLMLAKKPSVGFELMRQTDALEEMFPALVALIGCEQEHKWHPEGDVWIHTMMVIDEAAKIIRRDNLSLDESLIVMLAALCHDLGKPGTTSIEEGVIRSRGHEGAGEQPTAELLVQMGFEGAMIADVIPLVADHLKPCQLFKTRDEVSDSAIRRLANRVSITRLCLVAEADFLGRTTEEALAGYDPSVAWLRAKAEELLVQQSGPKSILMGRHLIEAGVAPGPNMGEILAAAYEAQLDGEFVDIDGALLWLSRNLPSL